MRNLAVLSAALLGAIATAGPAQDVPVDQGRFIITRGGQRIGTEDFSIRRQPSPGGDMITARATVVLDDRRLSPTLRADSAGAPLDYALEVRVGGEVQETLRGQVGRGRWSATVRTPRSGTTKEYMVADGALVLEDDVFHQYYFLARSAAAGSVPVVIPRRNVQVTMRVVNRGTAQLTVGGARVQATHLVLTEPDGATRQVWLDAQGRVLQVTMDASGVTATRDELPR